MKKSQDNQLVTETWAEIIDRQLNSFLKNTVGKDLSTISNKARRERDVIEISVVDAENLDEFDFLQGDASNSAILEVSYNCANAMECLTMTVNI